MSDDLRSAFGRAADDPARGHDPHDLDGIAAEVWRRGRRRRARTRAAAAAGGVVAAGAVLALGVGVLPGLLPQDGPEVADQGAGQEEPPADAGELPQPAPQGEATPTGSEDGAAPGAPDVQDEAPDVMAPQGEGDPADPVEATLPARASDLATDTVAAGALPAELDVPTGAEVADLPTLTEDPVESFSLVAEVPDGAGDPALVALAPDGDWRTVAVDEPLEPDDGGPWEAIGPAAVDPEGQRLAVAVPDAVLVVGPAGGIDRTPVGDAGLDTSMLRTPVWSADGTRLAVGVRDRAAGLVLTPGDVASVVAVEAGDVAAGWTITTADGSAGELLRVPVGIDGSREREAGVGLGVTASPGAGPVPSGPDLVLAAVSEDDQVADTLVAVGTGPDPRVGLLRPGTSGAAVPARVAGGEVLLVHDDADGQHLLRWDPASGDLTRVTSVVGESDPAAAPLVLAPGPPAD